MISKRVLLAILCATGVMELYMSRTNISIAIVEMVQTVTLDDLSTVAQAPREPFCLRDQVDVQKETMDIANVTYKQQTYSLSEKKDNSKIPMTSLERGNVLSAFFYAYGISSVIGGRLAEVYGTKRVFGTAVLVDALGNFLIPVASRTHYGCLFAIRFIMGLTQGACYPSLHSLVSEWIPPDEISRFIGFVYTANSFGTIFALTVCGLIISSIGWEYVFYVCGSISLVWLAFWIAFMHDSPQQHPWISEPEKNYILEKKSEVRSNSKKPQKVPWPKMMTSIPLWAANLAHAGNMLGLSFMITQLPIYLSSIIGINIKNNGILSSLPFLARFLGSNAFSWLSNFLVKRFSWKSRTWQIISTIISFGGTGVCIILVGYVGCSLVSAICLFVVAMTLNGASTSGYMCNHMELAPNFAGTAFGISTTIGFTYAMIGPVVVGALTPEETIHEWITVFWLMLGSYFVTGTIFCIFRSSELQPWNEELEQAPSSLEVPDKTVNGFKSPAS